ncbi:hypothetical protein BGW39_006820 [Mortierella sp. 14UC]|nr:hypothetical protein BGW39_006820 [Mortierella sp. 14UC]
MNNDQAPPSRIFSALPELVDLIGPELDPADLLSSIQVCRLWYQVLVPFLWSVIDESRYSWSKVLAIQDPVSIRGLFVKHGRFIHELNVHSQAMLDIVSVGGTCTKLRALKIYDPADKTPGTQYTDPSGVGGSLWDFVQANAELETLRFGSSLRRLLQDAGASAYERTLASLKNLVILQDYTGVLEPHEVMEQYPNIRGLLGSLVTFSRAEQLGAYMHLRSLELIRYTEGRAFLALLNGLCSLEQLTVAGLFDTGQEFEQDAQALLENTPLRLQGFCLRRQDLHDLDHVMATWIIPSMPHLKEFSATMLCTETTTALAAHATQLEVFCQSKDTDSIYPTYKPQPTLNIANLLFQSCIKLRIFDGIHHKIEADKMIEQPWVCRDLEVFRCQIVGLTRLAEREQAMLEIVAKVQQQQGPLRPTASSPSSDSSEPAATLERQQEYQDRLKKNQARQQQQHHQVYDQLACLTKLRTLDIGHEYRNVSLSQEKAPPVKLVDGQEYIRYQDNPISNTLELSLVSGLARLATLRRLQVFGFDGVDHRIGRAELGWVAETWPRLREMRGLHANLLPRSQPDRKRDELRGVMQGLRRDVRHRVKVQELPQNSARVVWGLHNNLAPLDF